MSAGFIIADALTTVDKGRRKRNIAEIAVSCVDKTRIPYYYIFLRKKKYKSLYYKLLQAFTYRHLLIGYPVNAVNPIIHAILELPCFCWSLPNGCVP